MRGSHESLDRVYLHKVARMLSPDLNLDSIPLIGRSSFVAYSKITEYMIHAGTPDVQLVTVPESGCARMHGSLGLKAAPSGYQGIVTLMTAGCYKDKLCHLEEEVV